MTIGVGEFGSCVLRIDNVELAVWANYTVTSNFLTATDHFHFTLGDELINPDLFKLLRPGFPVQLVINDKPQFAGYLEVVDCEGDRSTGNHITIEGRDVMGPVVDAELDPRKRYPGSTLLSKLVEDTLTPFGFSTFEVNDEKNSDVRAGLAVTRKRRNRKALNQYKLPTSKPHHNERTFDFLSRVVQRQGLWIWPTVDGKGVVVDVPDFEQSARYELRRRQFGADNNVLSGGIRRDSTDQPTYLVASGAIPPTEHHHSRMALVCEHPHIAEPEFLKTNPVPNTPEFVTLKGQNTGTTTPVVHNPAFKVRADQEARGLAANQEELSAAAGQPGSAGHWLAPSTGLAKQLAHNELLKWSTFTPAKQINLSNPFASVVSKPKYVKDNESHTVADLQHYLRRQMSLYVRRAVTGRYTFVGHELDGQPVAINTVVSIQDDFSDWHQDMWILAVHRNKSRSGGTTTTIECLPLNSLVF